MGDDKKLKASPSDYLANERTFLAWIRTGLGIMAFGFVVVKFSIFLIQVYALIGKENPIDDTTKGYSGVLGIILIGVGLITAVLPYFSYKITIQKLNRGEYNYSSLWTTVLTALLFIIGVLLIIYLIRTM